MFPRRKLTYLIETFIFEDPNDNSLVEFSSQMHDTAAVNYNTPVPSRKMEKIIEESESNNEEDDFETPRALKPKPVSSDSDFMETGYGVDQSEEDNRKETDYKSETDDLGGRESTSDLQECRMDLVKVQKQVVEKAKKRKREHSEKKWRKDEQ